MWLWGGDLWLAAADHRWLWLGQTVGLHLQPQHWARQRPHHQHTHGPLLLPVLLYSRPCRTEGWNVFTVVPCRWDSPVWRTCLNVNKSKLCCPFSHGITFPSPSVRGACVQLWYHMYGEGMGTLNVYQQSEDGKKALIFSQIGDQGRLWRFAQASLLPRVQSYRVSDKDPTDTVW